MARTHESVFASIPPAAPHAEISELERLQQRLGRYPWLLAALAAAVALAAAAGTAAEAACAWLVLAAVCLPVHLWIAGRVVGIPTLPTMALAYGVFYGLPFVSGNPIVAEYEADEKLLAAATVALFIVVATLIWSTLAPPGRPREQRVRMIDGGAGSGIFLGCLALACLFQLNSVTRLFSVPYEYYGVLRAVLHSMGIVSVFALAFLRGSRRLGTRLTMTYVALVVLFASASIMLLYLNAAMEIVFLAMFGYFLGSGRLPWRTAAALLVVFTVLQAGKVSMREQYWSPESGIAPPANPVQTIREWVGLGITVLVNPSTTDEIAPSLLERASLAHMLLRTQTEAPDRIPYLFGESYAGIPLLMIPRFVWPDRPTTHELLIRLNEHYGLLTREEAATTSIGWGLIAEANANFGFGGVVLLSVVMGVGLGLLQRWAGRVPLLSARGITALLVVVTLLRVETNMALFVTSLFQALVPVALFSAVAMRTRRLVV